MKRKYSSKAVATVIVPNHSKALLQKYFPLPAVVSIQQAPLTFALVRV
jgi:hypothetical protein